MPELNEDEDGALRVTRGNWLMLELQSRMTLMLRGREYATSAWPHFARHPTQPDRPLFAGSFRPALS